MPSKNWRYPVSFDSARKKQAAPAQAAKRSASRAKALRDLRVTIEEYILDHRSQNHSPKTIEWHTLSLGNFANFLEKKDVTCVEQIERVHILAWGIVNLSIRTKIMSECEREENRESKSGLV